jgi:protein SCO1/2
LLKGYVRAFDPSFIALTGTPAAIGRAATAYEVLYRRARVGANYVLAHSTVVYLIDRHGRERLAGNINTSVDDFTHDLRVLIGPT